MKSFKNFVFLSAIFFVANFSLGSLGEIVPKDRIVGSLWECCYCNKQILLPVYKNPNDSRHGYLHGCPNNEVEQTHMWWRLGEIVSPD